MLIQDIVPPKKGGGKRVSYLLKPRQIKKASKKALPVLLVVQIIVGILIPFNFSLNPSDISLQKTRAAGESWYNNWIRRKAIIITENSGSILTNYQIKITIPYDSDMQADFDDIRFTDSDGSALIDHWLESKTDSTTADFWIEIPTLTASSIKTIYMYYGNPSAASESSGVNTFVFFDDFEDGNLDGWEPYGLGARISNEWSSGGGVYSIKTEIVGDYEGIQKEFAVPGVRVLADVNIIYASAGCGLYTEPTNQFISQTAGTTYNWESNTITSSSYNLIFKNEPISGLVIGYIDQIRVRKYASPEPTASVGSEEEYSFPYAPTSPYCEGVADPTNISDITPEFSAIYNDPVTGDIANKYRIQVNTQSDFTGTSMWDSGAAGTSMTDCAEGTRCQDISYTGTALPLDGSGYFWRIKFWDVGGNEGEWSAAQSFTFTSDSWLSGWIHRKSIRIEEKSGSDLTNSSVLVTADTQSLISAGKLQSGCQDIRFTDKNGSTVIDYWIKSGCDTASTEIWIEIPSLLALTAQNIFFYYGNTSATSESSGANIFEFFDDFDDGDFSNVDNGSALGWYGVFNSIVEENGILTFSDATENDVSLQIDTGYPADYFSAGSVIKAKVKMTTGSTNFWLGMFADGWDNGWGETEVINEWVEISYTETTAFSKIGFEPYSFTDLANDQFQIDWIYVRKSASPEPNISTLATEEADTTSPTAFDISSPTNNFLTSNNKPTFSWNASSDLKSGLAKYQLYIDSSLNTDNISSSATSVTSVNSLSCGNHAWYVRAYDNANNYTDSSVFNLTIACGSGLPPSASNQPIQPEPTPENPEGGFSVLINNDDEYTDNETVTLKLSAGKDTERMAISNREDFKYASQIPYQEEYQWDLSNGRDEAVPRSYGANTVYAKFYTQYGVSSEVVSDSIMLNPIIAETETEETTGTETEEQPDDPNKEEPISETEDIKNPESSDNAEPDKTNPSQSSSFIFTKPLKLGSYGNEITQLQDKLKELNFFPKEIESNENFELTTQNAVKEYQASKEIYPCGIVGPRTRKALNSEEFITNKDHKFTKDLKYNDKNEEVKQLQTRLRDQNFFPHNIESTGWFGPITRKAVNIFQKFYDLIQSEVVDEEMRGFLNR